MGAAAALFLVVLAFLVIGVAGAGSGAALIAGDLAGDGALLFTQVVAGVAAFQQSSMLWTGLGRNS